METWPFFNQVLLILCLQYTLFSFCCFYLQTQKFKLLDEVLKIIQVKIF